MIEPVYLPIFLPLWVEKWVWQGQVTVLPSSGVHFFTSGHFSGIFRSVFLFSLPPLVSALPVGSRLARFLPFWQNELGCSRFVLKMVEGYLPPLFLSLSDGPRTGFFRPRLRERTTSSRSRGGGPPFQGDLRRNSSSISTSLLHRHPVFDFHKNR